MTIWLFPLVAGASNFKLMKPRPEKPYTVWYLNMRPKELTLVVVTTKTINTINIEWVRDNQGFLILLDLQNCAIWTARKVREGRQIALEPVGQESLDLCY